MFKSSELNSDLEINMDNYKTQTKAKRICLFVVGNRPAGITGSACLPQDSPKTS